MKHTVALVAVLACLVVPAQAGDPIRFSPIAHASFVMQTEGVTVYVDPVGERSAYAGFPKPDLILLTHTHRDHLAPKLLAQLKGEATVILGPPSVAAELPGTTVMKNGESLTVAGVRIDAVAMYNTTKERLKYHPKGQGNGYVVMLAGNRVYISGDTEDIPEMRGLKKIDYAFVCMNLPYTMTVEQAASAILDFRPRVIFPYHYRGKPGMADLKLLVRLLEKDKSIEVRLLPWYGKASAPSE
ncbi:MAG: MBL fold metallo-hydrolase [Planctomycetota bacterium]|jgi:L-ascorbate metabolism protein UlaG (beta-lactamase superfamily)